MRKRKRSWYNVTLTFFFLPLLKKKKHFLLSSFFSVQSYKLSAAMRCAKFVCVCSSFSPFSFWMLFSQRLSLLFASNHNNNACALPIDFRHIVLLLIIFPSLFTFYFSFLSMTCTRTTKVLHWLPSFHLIFIFLVFVIFYSSRFPTLQLKKRLKNSACTARKHVTGVGQQRTPNTKEKKE